MKFIFEILGFELKTSKKKIVDEKLLSEFFQKYNIKFIDIDSAMNDFRDKGPYQKIYLDQFYS